jgi:pSer/pThr/pTyr-binding forkhead associated (FHA) protein
MQELNGYLESLEVAVKFGIGYALIVNLVIASLGVIMPLFNITAAAESGGGYIPANTGGVIHCIAGEFQGADFYIRDNEELIFGRDAVGTHIVMANAPKVSRRHCGVRYNKLSDNYVVTDYSANGTFVVGGSRLVANSPATIAAGTMIYLGNKDNQFRLG